MRHIQRATAILLVTAITACAPKVAPPAAPSSPRFPGFPEPVTPAALNASPALAARQADAWRRLQAGDVRGAAREFTDILRADPAFFPAEAGLGFARLADRDPEQAAARFAAAAAKDDTYLPAWTGLVEARLAAGQDAEAIVALEKVIALDPTATEARARLDLLRFRQLPSLIEGGQRARRAGQLSEARTLLTQALALSPASGVILLELALVELDAGDNAAALRHARRATEVDPNNPEAHAALARTLEAAGNPRGAAASYARAVEIDPRPEWRDRVAVLSERADLAVMPPEFREVPTAATVNRAQVAAYLGIRLEPLVARAPARSTSVATDVRGHWAAPWILPVTRAGIMDVQPNHTFQPGEVMRRGDLAQVVSRLIALIPQRQMDLARWRAAKPRFADLPASNVFYPAAALAVAAGAMSSHAGSRFDATQPASGRDLATAVARIEQISGR